MYLLNRSPLRKEELNIRYGHATSTSQTDLLVVYQRSSRTL